MHSFLQPKNRPTNRVCCHHNITTLRFGSAAAVGLGRLHFDYRAFLALGLSLSKQIAPASELLPAGVGLLKPMPIVRYNTMLSMFENPDATHR
jgi:hypothetical protein